MHMDQHSRRTRMQREAMSRQCKTADASYYAAYAVVVIRKK
jgi:hypothetical protein